MTIMERINLHKYGYTKSEINALAEAEKVEPAPAADPEPVEPETGSTPATAPAAPQPQNADILSAINNLTAAIQAQNVRNAQQAAPTPAKSEDVLVGALNNL